MIDDSWRDGEIDWEGRSHCGRCGETWWASADEIRFQREQQAEYDAWCRRQERREFLRRLTLPVRWPVYRYAAHWRLGNYHQGGSRFAFA